MKAYFISFLVIVCSSNFTDFLIFSLWDSFSVYIFICSKLLWSQLFQLKWAVQSFFCLIFTQLFCFSFICQVIKTHSDIKRIVSFFEMFVSQKHMTTIFIEKFFADELKTWKSWRNGGNDQNHSQNCSGVKPKGKSCKTELLDFNWDIWWTPPWKFDLIVLIPANANPIVSAFCCFMCFEKLLELYSTF